MSDSLILLALVVVVVAAENVNAHQQQIIYVDTIMELTLDNRWWDSGTEMPWNWL